MLTYLYRWPALSAALVSLSLATSACSGDEIDDNAGSTGGTGSSGQAGEGGASGTGSSGQAGEGGASGTGSSGQAGEGGSGAGLGCDGLEGSYELATTFPDAPVMTMVVREASGTCEADVSPSWWPAALFDVSLSADTVSLSAKGRGAIFGGYDTPFEYRENELTSLSMPRQGAGLGNTFSAKVRNHVLSEDWYDDKVLDLEGTVGPSTMAPEVRVRRKWPVPPFGDVGEYGASYPAQWHGLPEALLPWDTVQVEASKPLDGLEAAISLVSTEPPHEPTGTVFVAGELADVGTAAGTWAWSRFSDWQAVAGTQQAIDVAAALTDASGMTLSPQSIPFEVLNVGPPHTAVEFDDEPGEIASWGDVTWEDAAGRLHLHNDCNASSGVAMMLDTSQAQKILIRVSGNAWLLMRGTGLSGQEYEGVESIMETGSEVTWQTFELDVAGESMVGFSVVSSNSCHWYDASDLLIDWIRVE